MNYLQKYDIQQFDNQIVKSFDINIRKEDKDFGLIDFSFAQIKDKIKFCQKEIKFPIHSSGNLISLVTHGYEKEKYVYGIALSIIKKYFDSYILSNGL